MEGVRTVFKPPTQIGLYGLINRRTKISRLGTFKEVENHIFCLSRFAEIFRSAYIQSKGRIKPFKIVYNEKQKEVGNLLLLFMRVGHWRSRFVSFLILPSSFLPRIYRFHYVKTNN
jgi:hypothetical protein